MSEKHTPFTQNLLPHRRSISLIAATQRRSTMHTLWLPIVPVVTLYLAIYLYNQNKGRRLVWRNEVGNNLLFILALGFMLASAIAFILDPNYYSDNSSPNSFGQLYTTTRMIAWWGVAFSYTGIYFAFIAPKRLQLPDNDQFEHEPNLLWIGLKTVFLLACLTAIPSGLHGFFYRSSWGLFQSQYISDDFLWWCEMGWTVLASIGLIFYFTQIRHWNGQENITEKSI